MKKLFFAFLAVLIATAALATDIPAVTAINKAIAADLPVKAPVPASAWLNGYPYGSSGLYVGLYTEGGGGSVTASVPGIASASLTTTTASIGATVGYAWGSKNSPFAYAIEGSACATNFNGANQGFALAGPLCFEQMGFIWMPVSLIQSTFSLLNIPNPFSSIAPFPVNPTGITASNIQAGFGAGAIERDMTIAYLGVGSNKVWAVAPQIEFALMEQLSNGSALQEYVKVRLQAKEILFGATQSAATPSTEIIAGVKVLF
jgi:hypothetical protein